MTLALCYLVVGMVGWLAASLFLSQNRQQEDAAVDALMCMVTWPGLLLVLGVGKLKDWLDEWREKRNAPEIVVKQEKGND